MRFETGHDGGAKARLGGGDADRTRGIGVRGPGYASNRNFAGTRATGARPRTSRNTSHRKLWPWKKGLRMSGSFDRAASARHASISFCGFATFPVR